ncbi:MAG: TIM44-like domain-containing protein [Cellulosilyticaceae bacterium]
MTGYLICFLIIGGVLLLAAIAQFLQTLPLIIQGLIYISVAISIVGLIIKSIKKRKAKSIADEKAYKQQQKEMAYRTSSANLTIIKARDKDFEEKALLQYAEAVLMKVFEVREHLDIEGMKFKTSDTLYELLTYQIEELQDTHTYEKHHIMQFLAMQIVDYRKDTKDEYIDIEIQAFVEKGRFDQKRHKVVRGEKYFAHQMTYKLTFIRKLGETTKGEVHHETQCENCGGVVDLSKGDYCPYCHTYIAMGSSSWILDNMEEYSRYA